jgi:thiamine-phosphate pyrophosphorylase
MFIQKKKYFLLIESTKDIDLKNIKIRNKFSIIYRNNKKNDNFYDLLKLRQQCKLKAIKFYIANNNTLAVTLNSDGIYLSSFNKSLKSLNYKKLNFDIIGSAHNFKEILNKVKQGCRYILFSKLFLVNYDKNAPFTGVIKFNNFLKMNKRLIPLGGINQKNLNKLNLINCLGFALLSEVKKKPANILSRLF